MDSDVVYCIFMSNGHDVDEGLVRIFNYLIDAEIFLRQEGFEEDVMCAHTWYKGGVMANIYQWRVE